MGVGSVPLCFLKFDIIWKQVASYTFRPLYPFTYGVDYDRGGKEGNRSPSLSGIDRRTSRLYQLLNCFAINRFVRHFDFRPGQVSLLWLRVQWLFWCLATVMDSVVLTVNLVFWGVMPCSLIVTGVSKDPNAYILRVNFLDCLFLRMKA